MLWIQVQLKTLGALAEVQVFKLQMRFNGQTKGYCTILPQNPCLENL